MIRLAIKALELLLTVAPVQLEMWFKPLLMLGVGLCNTVLIIRCASAEEDAV
jgi:hypothetical protein